MIKDQGRVIDSAIDLTPGPGNYEVAKSLDKVRKAAPVATSAFKSTRERFKNPSSKAPGPGIAFALDW